MNKMPNPELQERLAKLEVLLERYERDIYELHDLIRAHMEREEEERLVLLQKISSLESQTQAQQKFVGGIVFTVSSLWAVGLALWEIFKR